MLSYEDVNIILHLYYDEDKTKTQIKEFLGFAKSTIRKYITRYKHIAKLEYNERVEYLQKHHKRKSTRTEIIKQAKIRLEKIIKEILRSKGKTARIIRTLLEDRLIREGYDICYTTVCKLVKEILNEREEAYLKMKHFPGDKCQFDWANETVYINGQKVNIKLAIFSSPYSNFRKAYAFYRETADAFVAAHNKFFNEIDGVYDTMVYDNMKTIQKKYSRVKKNIEPTRLLKNISNHYGFDYQFCNAGKGNEKGHVEIAVNVVRQTAFNISSYNAMKSFNSLAEVNEHLNKITNSLNNRTYNGKLITKKFKKELSNMVKPSAIDYIHYIHDTRKVGRYSVIEFAKNNYSVEDDYVGKEVDIYYNSKILRVIYKNKIIAEHRLTDDIDEKYYFKIHHYFKTLRRKSNGLSSCYQFYQLPEILKNTFNEFFYNKPKEFIEFLEDRYKNNYEDSLIYKAIANLKAKNTTIKYQSLTNEIRALL